MNDLLFELKDLKKSFGEREIFNIPHLKLSQGKIYAVVGPNGSGKTTFLKILNTLEKPTSGKVLFKGKDLYDSPDLLKIQREMTIVMQNPYLFNTTVFKNVAYGLRLRNLDRKAIDESVEKSLELVGLSHLKEERVAHLSGGEAQRVAIARGLSIKPKVLFLDEPTANVDQVNIKIIEEIILKIREEKDSTIIITTHNPTQAYLLADKVLSIINRNLSETYYENIFQGEIKKGNGIKIFSKNNIEICLTSNKLGRAIISIDPRDIILSHKPFESSARNSFRGKIKKISEIKEQIKVVVNVGLDFAAIITKESCAEMKLMIGSEVFLTFKTSSVQVY